ncbi:very long chain fatty acid elongase 6-like [Branchiostoma lanceolatum]|uniref:very long chain fatty acid elongase 6-like n=1 Tax=Branchiostoma lanceolatum TaxID=7740 RepID=UPI00345195EF
MAVLEGIRLPEDDVVPSVVPPFEFEERFDAAGFHRWFRARWWWSAVFSAAYVLLVFGGRRLMRHREPFRLRLPLVLWNSGLALFSLLGTLRMSRSLLQTARHEGFVRSVCDEQGTHPVAGLWIALFALSKIVEFGDTAFLVLRKRPLIFLHWYHHVLTCIYTWYGYAHLVAPCSYFTGMNLAVHSVMYSYYAVRAAGFRLPKGLSMVITALQIAQMAAGLFLIVIAQMTLGAGEPCDWSNFDSILAASMYASYFVLFLNFFRMSYFSKSLRIKKE